MSTRPDLHPARAARRMIVLGLIVGLALAIGGGMPALAQPDAQSTEQLRLVEMVNALRAEYGLPPYQPNAELMAAAQRHSEWAAMVGTHSHTGVGGSTPRDRAIAAGYGGGRVVRVSENIYWGTLATAESAMEWWRNSPIHFQGMTSTNYLEIGTGAAHGAQGGFYTLMFGLASGDAPAAPAGPAPSAGTAQPLPAYVVEPVEVAQPREDGSVVHVVGEGQNVWTIAEAYQVPVSEVLALNRLDEKAILQPGDELVIVPAPVQATAEQTGPVVHTVEAGQTLFGIALTYDVTLEQVLALNNLSASALIFPGDRLLIVPDPNQPAPAPGPVYHLVQAGETLIGIALAYGIELDTLYQLNGMSETTILRPGDQVLIRPAPTPSPPTPTPALAPTEGVRATPTPGAAPELASTPAAGPPRRAAGTISPLAIGAAVAGVIVVGLMVARLARR